MYSRPLFFVLSSFFGEANNITDYIAGMVISGLTLYLGLQLIKGKPQLERNNENTDNQNEYLWEFG